MSSEAAKIYNYRSPLEHFSVSCALAGADEIGLFSDMRKDVAKQIRLHVIDLVLATDMSNLFSLVSSFGAMVAAKRAETTLSSLKEISPLDTTTVQLSPAARPTQFFAEKFETRMLILKIAMKISDLGHCFLAWEEHMSWCDRLEAEFFSQGDAECDASLAVSPLMDRRRPGVSNHGNSVGFFQTFPIPMLELWIEIFPHCSPILKLARSNLDEHCKLRGSHPEDEVRKAVKSTDTNTAEGLS
jgi:calcium/calmodulin-dependent 3',5'-cyclic nucleotide phosphodiesterase